MSPVFAIIDAPIIAIIIGAAVILFGAERLPKLARSMGQAKKEFEAAAAAKTLTPEVTTPEPPAPPPAPPPVAPPTPPAADIPPTPPSQPQQ